VALWNTEFAPPRPRYVVGFELSSGRVLRLADAESFVWGQVVSSQVRARVVVEPGG
jgi:hypothetical protein